jgi:hypothetical protein
MAIQLLVKKPVVVEQAPALSTFAETLDKMADLQDEIAALDVKIAAKAKAETIMRQAAAAKLAAFATQVSEALLEVHADDDPDAEFEELGSRFKAKVSKQGTERKVTDVEKVSKLMGKKVFWSLAKVNLGDIDKYLTPEEKLDVITTSRKPRSVSFGPV